MTQSLTIARPDDWHLHLRDGAVLKAVLPHTVRQFARAIVMPNLKPPVRSVADAAAYRDRILAAIPAGQQFDPLMTLYLTDNTSPEEIIAAKALLGFLLTTVMAWLTLAINGALTAEPLALLLTLALASVTCIEIGLIYGTVSRDVKTVYSLGKTLNIFILGPLIFFFFLVSNANNWNKAIPKRWKRRCFPISAFCQN